MSIEATAHCSIFIPPDSDEDVLDGFFLELDTLLEEGVEAINIDCSLLNHTRSGHINALWDALTRCEEAGVPMRLTSVGYGLERLLKVLDLHPLLPGCEDIAVHLRTRKNVTANGKVHVEQVLVQRGLCLFR